jgi:hypothetical protein
VFSFYCWYTFGVNKRAAIGGLIILVILGLAFYESSGIGRKWKTIPLPTSTVNKVNVVPTVDFSKNLESYTNTTEGYSISKPSLWTVQEITNDDNFDNRVVLLPELNSGQGSISEMSITVIKKPVNNQVLASDKEWNTWLNNSTGATDSSGLVVKKGEKMVEGNRAVVLWQEKELPEGFTYSIMTWIRKNGVNYYIDALGNGAFTAYETNLFDTIVGTFSTK